MTTPSDECPAPTGYTISVATLTTVILSTVTTPLPDLTCVSSVSNSSIPTGNATFPSGTGAGLDTSIAMPTYISTVTTTSTSTIGTTFTSTPTTLFRQPGTIATPEQISAACANPSQNVVFNPGFELGSDGNASGWSTEPSSPSISFLTFQSDNAGALSGRRSGRVLSAESGASIVVSTPVILCPGRQYRLSGYTRQLDTEARCSIVYRVGDRVVYTAVPQTDLLAMPRTAFYEAGSSDVDVSVDLSLTVSCVGQGGAVSGVNDEGYMQVDFDDIALVQVQRG
ncbi:uncharacterized protein EI97DRAFT_437740 [Westerdykella ornata]|uniref:CBM-cenC domain-containing protein n=1 Tax=Westerdykella ornata TaxID=318751 RepID=A0A6A6J536_WESOR|nr:uncharacterized protein EI97DRAFT_437740 [Westerdykella ornata]KAF2271555.1 hypothetical protein EI97DRAFT_437740 [Westerdykella ornata]